jgi:prepilin-type processing-associated H-X9-DG protein
MVEGKDENDPLIPLDLTAIGTYIDSGIVTLFNMYQGILQSQNMAEAAQQADGDLPIKHASPQRDMTAYRIREGIERFFITDINNPAASSKAQSEIAIQWDQVVATSQNFNHVPGGANVLYMDGHVEFLRYPSKHPINRAFTSLIEAVMKLSQG